MTTNQSFLLDENVDVRVGKFLKEGGHDVVFVPKGIRNGEVLALAANEHRILVTHDADFLDAFLTHKNLSVAIIVLRIHPPTKTNVTQAFTLFLSHLGEVKPAVIYELTQDGFKVYERGPHDTGLGKK
ncbi:hypothetical protein A2971_05160 [Candidatus Gottesmanbacteria bacterium RIFCSPLOWO2_01_FULL_46_21]|uniref:DUF5615 domain-containing protein n=1 Tax=Candidatus Gottesmanbacteria bacterium RIFCSPLOWO2_01_FULL_46_21 TaxID=1798393 RepID=A0A1F6AYX3_9BACT|nr:MAG: hypothetical protein A2971_05160 [Candidatus Gottesmanbacteria bacterium RIFCSPLOWO2_01_FULL_46_21]